MAPTFRATANAILAANRLASNRRAAAASAASARHQQARLSSSSTDDNERRFRAIECSIKKIELQLKLVDGEIMGNKEFSDLKSEILDCDRPNFSNMEETMDFLRSVDNKRADNRYKQVLKIISIICPLLSACNIGFLKEVNTEEISSELIGDAINKSKSYLSTFTGAVNYFIENGDEGADKIETLMDLNVISSDAFDNYKDMAEISKVKIGKITRNALTIQKEFGKYLIIKSKKISKNIYNKMSWKILSKAFCTCVFYYILFSSVVGVDINQSEYITDRFMEVEGGSSEDGVSGGGGKKKKNKRRD
jgi:hypothetical protein